MWTLTENDFEQIKSWGLAENPFKAVSDYSDLKSELRWLNPEQMTVYKDYVAKREAYIQTKDFDDYYRVAKKPIDKQRWEFLKDRKAWFIMPLGWEQIALEGGTAADLGCGDGDTVQRLVDFTAEHWQKKGITGKKLHITGIDLNASRIENAKQHVTSRNPHITFDFQVGDLVKAKLGSVIDRQFDFSLCCGVLEILNDHQFNEFMNEMCRVTRKGIFIEDLYERFPGGFPRDSLGRELFERGFIAEKRHVILSEPFNIEKLQDPKKLWPALLDQNLWARRKPVAHQG